MDSTIRYNGNYYSQELNFRVNESEAYEKQRRIREQLRELSKGMSITFLTPFEYEQGGFDV